MENQARQWKPEDFKTPAGRVAKKIIDLLIKKELWQDTFLYFDGKRVGCYDGEKYHYDNDWNHSVYVEDDMDPKDYFTYTSDFLSVSTEGPLYDLINYGTDFGGESQTVKELEKIIDEAGFFMEQGDAWNFGLYKK